MPYAFSGSAWTKLESHRPDLYTGEAALAGVNVKSTISASIVLLFAAANGMSQRTTAVRIHDGFVQAHDYLEMDSEAQKTYAMGILDGFYMAPLFGAPDNNKVLVSITTCVEGMKASQVAAIIEKYVKDHPEHWHLDLKNEAYSGMRQACP